VDHECKGSHPRAIFCATCGRELVPGSLRSVRFQGFTGPASLNTGVEAFWHTGDPDHVSPDPVKRERAKRRPVPK